MITAEILYNVSVAVAISGGPGNIRDYVALYAKDAATYFSWRYLNNTTVKTQGSPTGIVKFMSLLKGGNYEAKFFALTDGGVATLLESAPFIVGGTVLVEPDPGAGSIPPNAFLLQIGAPLLLQTNEFLLM